jgi:hypothetical protein
MSLHALLPATLSHGFLQLNILFFMKESFSGGFMSLVTFYSVFENGVPRTQAVDFALTSKRFSF